MTDNPSRAIALYGTEEAVPDPTILTAGPLSAELEAGNLRYIRWQGEEVLRAVSFIVRDPDWGTYNPDISDLEIDESEDRFEVRLRAVTRDAEQVFSYRARIEGRADGTLIFHGTGRTGEGFRTNRTGFVILHPIDGVAGSPVTIEHTGGETVEGTFPEIIDPVQPMMDLRALTHRTPGGARVRVLMEGDTYEMEDQRNWTDASYKTYVRPLARPWPYRIEPREGVDQTITITVSGGAPNKPALGAVTLNPGTALGAMPPLGAGFRPEETRTATDLVESLRPLGLAHLVLHHDPRSGHGRETLSDMLAVARNLNAEPWLEAVVAATDTDDAMAEVADLGRVVTGLDAPLPVVMISPAPDLKCTLPGSEWPDAPDAATLYDAARAAFPKARIGGGMFSYFTELNRKRPPVEHLDFVTFTTTPIVHAGDDRSVMETREAHPAIVKSVAEIAGEIPWIIGPSAIGIRDNPYGAAAKENPGNIRQAMNLNDPRQRGLMGAAWALAYIGDFARGGAAAITLGGLTGPFGVLSAPASWPQPWYEGAGGLFPIFHVLRGLARLRGATMHDLGLARSAPVSGLATDDEIWVANMGAEKVEVSAPDGARVAVLDAAGFAEAARTPTFMDQLDDLDGTLALDGHAVARIVTRHAQRN
ncbi:MAG: hypothetical protein WBA67_00425 [Jannaschia sp.]